VQALRRFFHRFERPARITAVTMRRMELRVGADSEQDVAARRARTDDLRAGADELFALADAQQRRADELRRTARLLLEQAHDLEENAGGPSQLSLGILPASRPSSTRPPSHSFS
jgi:hypothetical protein